jgi:hypothetical protein
MKGLDGWVSILPKLIKFDCHAAARSICRFGKTLRSLINLRPEKIDWCLGLQINHQASAKNIGLAVADPFHIQAAQLNIKAAAA